MRAMFTTVAPRYDFITRAFSYGMDRHWKRTGVERAELPERPVVLDLAAGTGDFSLMVAQQYPGSRAVAVDITERMLQLARERGVDHTVCADAGAAALPRRSFDCVFVGYGLRNFPNLNMAVREIERVTRPGGMLVSLDFFLPSNAADAPAVSGLPLRPGRVLGMLLHGRPRVYTYIPDSLRSFVSIDDFSSLLRAPATGRWTCAVIFSAGSGCTGQSKITGGLDPPLG